jgi:hypothetical protein
VPPIAQAPSRSSTLAIRLGPAVGSLVVEVRVAEERVAHPVAELFPMMSAIEMAGLIADIKENGLRDAITLHRDGRILDGRNRYHACMKTGVSPWFETFEEADERVFAFVASRNLHRRHLGDEQRALIAAQMANMKRGDAAKVQGHDRDGLGRIAGNRQLADTGNETLISAAKAAEAMNVPKRSVERARAVLTHAPELAPAITAGEMSLSAAADEAVQRAKASKPAERAPSRPAPKPEPQAGRKAPKLGPPRDGMQFARMALLQLEQIREDDAERAQAFAHVREWLDARET